MNERMEKRAEWEGHARIRAYTSCMHHSGMLPIPNGILHALGDPVLESLRLITYLLLRGEKRRRGGTMQKKRGTKRHECAHNKRIQLWKDTSDVIVSSASSHIHEAFQNERGSRLWDISRQNVTCIHVYTFMYTLNTSHFEALENSLV